MTGRPAWEHAAAVMQQQPTGTAASQTGWLGTGGAPRGSECRPEWARVGQWSPAPQRSSRWVTTDTLILNFRDCILGILTRSSCQTSCATMRFHLEVRLVHVGMVFAHAQCEVVGSVHCAILQSDKHVSHRLLSTQCFTSTLVTTPSSQRCSETEALCAQGCRMVFPPGDKEAVEVTAADLARLDPGEFLNDTVIDYYIKCAGHDGERVLPEAQGPCLAVLAAL